MSYEVGSKVTMSFSVTDLAGAPADATLDIFVTKPSGAVVMPHPTPVHVGTGQYTAEVTVDAPGDWLYEAFASAGVVAAYSNQFNVRRPGLRIVSLAQTKIHLNMTDTTKDDELRAFIDAAQEVIEGIVGPVVPTERLEIHYGGNASIVLNHRPVFSVTSVTEYRGDVPYLLVPEVGGGLVDTYRLDYLTGIMHRRNSRLPGVFAMGDVEVLYSPGWNPVPANITMAAQDQIGHLWRNSQLARGNARQAASADDVIQSTLAYALPNRVQELVASKKRAPLQGH